MTKKRTITLVAAIALAAGMIPMSGCSWQQISELLTKVEEVVAAQSGASMQTTEVPGESASADFWAADAADAADAPDLATADMSSWTTLGDALANATTMPDYGYDGNYFVCVFQSGDSYIRAVAEMESDVADQFFGLDFLAEDYAQQFANVVGGLQLVEVEDITAGLLDQDDLDALVGKTGQELVDEGFTFGYYNFRSDGGESGAAMDNGYFCYSITFDAAIPSLDLEDGGAAIMDAPVISAQYAGLSEKALDPASVE